MYPFNSTTSATREDRLQQLEREVKKLKRKLEKLNSSNEGLNNSFHYKN